MPPLIALGVLGAGLYFGYRWITRQGAQVAAQLERAEEALKRREARRNWEDNGRELTTLEQDPETGVYRVPR